MNKTRVKRLVLIVFALVIAAQFLQPRRTNPPVVPSRAIESHVPVPSEVLTILKRDCGDCHSNQTVWPWYGHVAPFSWVVTDDVNEGRRHMNFQDWEAQDNPKPETERLAAICKEVHDGGMPPFTYRMMHKESRPTPEDTGSLCSWSGSLSASPQTAVPGRP